MAWMGFWSAYELVYLSVIVFRVGKGVLLIVVMMEGASSK